MNRRMISFVLVLLASLVSLITALRVLGASLPTASAQGNVIINEVDSDTPGTDALEFVELYDGGVGNTSLDGLAVVFFNGNGDVSYTAFDLDGFSTDANGYFLLGNTAVVPAPEITFSNNSLQNGADAVALYMGNAGDFPDDTPVTTTNLVDALVYDTGQADGAGLLILLNPGQPQVNEAGGGDEEGDSNQRCPNGSGGARNTDTYTQNTPTPGAENNCGAPPAAARIREIQGTGHKSPLEGQLVQDVPGIVTAIAANGFYLQDPSPDGNVATSEGIFVFTSSTPSVTVGDSLLVDGAVAEFYPGGISSGNLSITELTSPLSITVQSSGNALPSPVVIGNGGRVPPNQVIDDDANGNVEVSGTFDADSDGVDFYESLEGMLIQVNDAVAVGPTTGFGEIAVVGDNGAEAGTRSGRGGLVIQPSDFNPERIIIDDELVSNEPNVNVGDRFDSPITGTLSYSFGNFKLLNSIPLPGVTADGLISETTALSGTVNQLTVAGFNVENLDPGDEPAKFNALAVRIVHHLRSPDIISLEEVQDNTGPSDDGVVDASLTYSALITAIQTAGGPVYDFRDIAPQNNQDGGEPGGNIRVGFLFRPDRVTFVDRGSPTATDAVTVTTGITGVELSLSPGRIDPTNSAFADSRKPLAGEFLFGDRKLFVIANHFNSKGGDNPLFGRTQPPVLTSEAQRIQQAQIVNNFVDSILTLDASAGVIVLGDLNDFQFSTAISATLAANVLTNLVNTLPITDQYTFIFDGNSQVLDHLLISQGLLSSTYPEFDIVHMNADLNQSVRPSDHEPLLARFTFGEQRIYLPVILKTPAP